MKDNKILPLTEFDIATCGTDLQMLKACVPFLPSNKQKDFALFIRISELMSTLDFYKKFPTAEGIVQETTDLPSMLKEIRCYCDSSDFEFIDMLSNMKNMNELKSIFDTVSNANSDPTDTSDALLKNMLSPKQQELFEEYKKILNI